MQNWPKARSALQTKRKKNQQKVAISHQEVKDTVVHGHTSKRICIPTNKIGEITHLKGVW
jgi:hypothetical protein